MSLLAISHRSQPENGRSLRREWLSFLAQITLVTSVEVADELLRGSIAQSDSRVGALHAHDVVQFEAAHGFWVEPGWQQFFEHTHQLLGITITWERVTPVVNTLYVLAHIFVTLFFAIWVFFYRRGIFAFIRNIFFAINALALVLYETYPLAPPRLTNDLIYNGHPFRFVDTLFQVLGPDGKVKGTQIGYNEFAAMPSLHVGWALIVSLTLAWVLRPWAIRLLVLLYPVLMLMVVVVTGNHYLMDAVGAAGILVIAVLLALAYEWMHSGRVSPLAVLRELQRRRHQRTAGHQGQGTLHDEQQPQAVA